MISRFAEYLLTDPVPISGVALGILLSLPFAYIFRVPHND
jgi:hypothetical protein